MNHLIRICLAVFVGLYGAGVSGAVELRVEGAPDALVSALEGVLDEMPEPETRFEAARQARRAAGQLTAYLNSRAYYAAELTPGVTDGEMPVPTVTIAPGPQFLIGQITVSYADADMAAGVQDDVRMALALMGRQLALPDDIIAAERRALKALQAAGYGEAVVAPRDIIGDAGAGTIDVEFVLRPGPRLRLGRVIYENDTGLRDSYLDVLVPFAEDDVYAPATLGALDRRLGETRLFDVFSARLAETPASTAENGDEVRDIIVTTTPRKRFSIALGGGFSTTEGVGATAELLTRNLTGRGDPLRVTAVAAAQEISLGAVWDLPHILGYGRSLNTNGLIAREDTDAFDRTALLLGSGLDISRGNGQVLGFGIGGEYSRETDAAGQRDLFIFSTSAEIRLDRTDSLLDPSRGWRAGFRVEPVVSVGDEEAVFFTTTASGNYYQPFGADDKFVFATRARLSSVIGASTEELPVGRRLFAGGGGSARGFGFQEVGPLDADDVPLGGRGLVELSGELRWRFNKTFGFAAFADSASISDDSAPDFGDLRVGVGAGIRYYTAIGPVRLDIATPLDRRDGEDVVQVSISIGQAF